MHMYLTQRGARRGGSRVRAPENEVYTNFLLWPETIAEMKTRLGLSQRHKFKEEEPLVTYGLRLDDDPHFDVVDG